MSSRVENLISAVFLVLVTLISYGTQINKLGFYRDDWYLLWTFESLGADGLLNIFKVDRPFIGWLYIFDFSVVGVSPLGWHLYALLLKILSGLAVLWLLRGIWRNYKIETTLIAALFLVYPGFFQQPNALTYKQLLMAYLAAILSLALSIRALKSGSLFMRVMSIALAMGLSIFYILVYEALVGMEIVRLVLIWYVIKDETSHWKTGLLLAFKRSLPYLIFAFAFVVWRLFFFESARRATNVDVVLGQYASLYGLTHFFFEFLKDIFETSILAWAVPFYQFAAGSLYRDLGFALALGLAVAILAFRYSWFMSRSQPEAAENKDRSSPRDWVLLGLAIVILTTLPIVLAGRNAQFSGQWDRYTYQSSLGAALLIGGFVFYALRGQTRWILLSMLLVSSVSTQIFSQLYYRDFWNNQRQIWWQLYWRAPQIESGTTVIASIPFGFAEEYEIWGPLNLIYHRGEPLQIPAQVPTERLEVDLERGTLESRIVRGTIEVNRDYNRVLIASMPSTSSCLHIYGLIPAISINEQAYVKLTAPYSNTDFIQLDKNSPPPPIQIMGDEPAHTWCYYYQKMNALLQTGDWAGAAKQAEQARLEELQPADVSEWLVPLIAYANNGDEKRTKQVATYINDNMQRLYLCRQLGEVENWHPGYRNDLIMQYLCRRAE